MAKEGPCTLTGPEVTASGLLIKAKRNHARPATCVLVSWCPGVLTCCRPISTRDPTACSAWLREELSHEEEAQQAIGTRAPTPLNLTSA